MDDIAAPRADHPEPSPRQLVERLEAGCPATALLDEHPGLTIHDLRDAVEQCLDQPEATEGV